MNPKNVALSAKNFVTNHKVAIAVVTTAAVTTAMCVKMQRGAIAQVNEFLTEKGLYEEFQNRFNKLDN